MEVVLDIDEEEGRHGFVLLLRCVLCKYLFYDYGDRTRMAFVLWLFGPLSWCRFGLLLSGFSCLRVDLDLPK